MRERMQAAKPKKAAPDRSPSIQLLKSKNRSTLLKRIEVLEAENASLRHQLSASRDQPKAQERTSAMSDSEQRYLFMKYSNVRRY